jgi:hypothetical protein
MLINRSAPGIHGSAMLVTPAVTPQYTCSVKPAGYPAGIKDLRLIWAVLAQWQKLVCEEHLNAYICIHIRIRIYANA